MSLSDRHKNGTMVTVLLLLFLYYDVVNLRSQAVAIFYNDYEIMQHEKVKNILQFSLHDVTNSKFNHGLIKYAVS